MSFLLSYLKASSSHGYFLLYRNNRDCTSITTLNFHTISQTLIRVIFRFLKLRNLVTCQFNNIFRVWQGFSFVKIPLCKCCTGNPIYSSAPLNFLKLIVFFNQWTLSSQLHQTSLSKVPFLNQLHEFYQIVF